jgi:SOS response regulatory protein OraA/RecX
MHQHPARRKLVTETQLYMSAQRALMRRAHSIHEMKQHLERRAEDKALVPQVIARLRELNYLDDAEYALNYASQHAKIHRQGRFRIARELRARGIPDRHIQAAIDAAFVETDETALVRARLQRRLAMHKFKTGTDGSLPSDQLDPPKIASLYRNLLSAGFSSEIIRAELKRITNAALPDSDVPGTSEDEVQKRNDTENTPTPTTPIRSSKV